MDEATELIVNAAPRRFKLLSVDTQNWFKFEAVAGETYVIETFNSLPYDEDEGWPGSMDPVIYLIKSDSSELAYDDDSGNDPYEALIEWTAPDAGTFYIRLQHYGYYYDDGLPGSYDISVVRN